MSRFSVLVMWKCCSKANRIEESDGPRKRVTRKRMVPLSQQRISYAVVLNKYRLHDQTWMAAGTWFSFVQEIGRFSTLTVPDTKALVYRPVNSLASAGQSKRENAGSKHMAHLPEPRAISRSQASERHLMIVQPKGQTGDNRGQTASVRRVLYGIQGMVVLVSLISKRSQI